MRYLYLKMGGLKLQLNKIEGPKLYLSLYFNLSASAIHWPMAYHKCKNINWDFPVVAFVACHTIWLCCWTCISSRFKWRFAVVSFSLVNFDLSRYCFCSDWMECKGGLSKKYWFRSCIHPSHIKIWRVKEMVSSNASLSFP